MAKTATMPLDHAHDALGDCVLQFCNDMRRRGVKELTPREWVAEFCAWLDPHSFEREYESTKQWLAAARKELRARVKGEKPDE